MEPEPLLGLPRSQAAARQWLGQRVPGPASATSVDDVVVLNGPPTHSLIRLRAAADRVRYLVADCVLWSFSAAQLDILAAIMIEAAPERSVALFFLEPTAGLGWRDRMQRHGAGYWRRRHGHRFTRDIPAELRAHGLTVTTTIRFREGPVRHYVVGEARWYQHLHRAR